ncbi:MAG: DUF2064 domain-containing protein [Opitutaceae bacterium]
MSLSASTAQLPAHAADSVRSALLVFARSAADERAARGLPLCLAPLFRSVVEREAISSQWAVHLFTLDGSAPGRGAGLSAHRQIGPNFKARLHHAVGTLVEAGYERIVIVGNDCPDLSQADIDEAFHRLDDHDAVLGPDHRGGNYLIGLRAADAALLDRVVWRRNTDHAQLGALYAGRPVARLAVKIDLDRWRDLRLFAQRASVPARLLAQYFAWLEATGQTGLQTWVDLATADVRVRHMTSPPTAALLSA